MHKEFVIFLECAGVYRVGQLLERSPSPIYALRGSFYTREDARAFIHEELKALAGVQSDNLQKLRLRELGILVP